MTGMLNSILTALFDFVHILLQTGSCRGLVESRAKFVSDEVN